MNDKEKIPISEKLIKELYIDLRKNVNKWSKITNQTPQARMGYIGQHLVSIVTGYPGGKSGARGHDLIINDSKDNIEFAEIKTCYRVDQLGKCNHCQNPVSSLEKICSFCGSQDIKRMNDSKWLITILNPAHLITTFEPKYYYFVLFEFEDTNNVKNNTINATIWRVDTKSPGFYLCMLDYYYNIRSKSKSAAPFNMWPHMLKFHLTKPVKIYESKIYEDDSINTILLDNNLEKKEDNLLPLYEYSKSKILDVDTILKIFDLCNIEHPSTSKKTFLLKKLEEYRSNISNEKLADIISFAIYYPKIKDKKEKMPKVIQDYIKRLEELFL